MLLNENIVKKKVAFILCFSLPLDMPKHFIANNAHWCGHHCHFETPRKNLPPTPLLIKVNNAMTSGFINYCKGEKIKY